MCEEEGVESLSGEEVVGEGRGCTVDCLPVRLISGVEVHGRGGWVALLSFNVSISINQVGSIWINGCFCFR